MTLDATTGVAAATLVLGILLMGIEVFVIPGFGFAGLGGGLLMLVGAGLAWHAHGAATGLVVLAASGAASVALVWVFVKSGAAKKLVLDGVLDGAGEAPDERPRLVGCSGVAVTNLRPAGSAEIDGRRWDVVTSGEFVEPGTPVSVVEVEGFRVVVEAAAPDEKD